MAYKLEAPDLGAIKERYEPKLIAPVLSVDEMDAYTIERVPIRLIERDIEVIPQAWFDYRVIHPLQATEHLIEHYKYAHRLNAVERMGVDGIYCEGVSKASRRTLLAQAWKVRQSIDELGIPYPSFISLAFAFTRERGYRYLPRLSQIGSEKIIEGVKEKWVGRLRSQVIYATNSAVLTTPGVAEKYRLYLINRAKLSQTPEFMLYSMISKNLFTEEELKPYFPDAILDRVSSLTQKEIYV